MSKAEAVLAEQAFRATGESGHAGAGIYFWAVDESYPAVAMHLAQLWWAFYSKKKRYEDDVKKDCAVLHVCIANPGEPEYYDATTQSFRNAVACLAHSLCEVGDFDVAAAHATILSKIEGKLGRKILVFKALVQSPTGAKEPSVILKSFPASDAYIVRNGGERLIEKIELLN